MAKTITNSDLDKKLVLLESKVDSGHEALRQQLGAGYELILEKLKPLDELKKSLEETKKTVERQGRAIAWVYGAGAAISTAFGGTLAFMRSNHK